MSALTTKIAARIKAAIENPAKPQPQSLQHGLKFAVKFDDTDDSIVIRMWRFNVSPSPTEINTMERHSMAALRILNVGWKKHERETPRIRENGKKKPCHCADVVFWLRRRNETDQN